MSHVEYVGDQRRGKLVVDGKDLSEFVAPHITFRTGEGPTTVEATLVGRTVTYAVDGLLHLTLPDEVQALLVAAGWTPPPLDDE